MPADRCLGAHQPHISACTALAAALSRILACALAVILTALASSRTYDHSSLASRRRAGSTA